MITAREIHRQKFEKVKFGYSPEEVDAFLARVEADLKLMEQELADSNDKLQVLADKVSEYKENEDDIRNALISAQRQAREVIEEAKAKAAQIEADARAEVDSVTANARQEQEVQLKAISAQLEQENQTLVATQKQVSAFKKALFDMYKKHLEQISKLPESVKDIAPVPAPAPKAEPAEEKKSAEEPVAEAPAEETPAVPVEEEATAAESADAPAKDEVEAAFEQIVRERPSQSFGSRRDDSRRDRKKRF